MRSIGRHQQGHMKAPSASQEAAPSAAGARQHAAPRPTTVGTRIGRNEDQPGDPDAHFEHAECGDRRKWDQSQQRAGDEPVGEESHPAVDGKTEHEGQPRLPSQTRAISRTPDLL